MQITTIVILGGHVQALGFARQAKRINLKVIIVTNDRFSISRFSNTVDKTLIHYNFDNDLLNHLQSISSPNTLLLPTSDDYICFIETYRNQLETLFVLAQPCSQTIRLFADKKLTYQFALQNGIAHPHSLYLTDVTDIYSISESVAYPVVIKPSVMFTFHKTFGKKAFLCHNKEELVVKVREIANRHPIDQLIIQEFLSGGAKNLYSCGVFAIDGKIQQYVVVNRKRQNPMDFGNSTTYAVTCNIPEILMSAQKILALTRYTGIAEVEFMYDDGLYKFLEVNTRGWKWHTISEMMDFSFLESYINYLMKSTAPNNLANTHTNSEVAWVERLTDFFIIIKEWFGKRINFRDIRKDYKVKKAYAIWRCSDPLPGIMYILLSPIIYLKRH